MYIETHPEDNLTVLIDYYGREYSDALEVCRWWYNDILPRDGERVLRPSGCGRPSGAIAKLRQAHVCGASRCNERCGSHPAAGRMW